MAATRVAKHKTRDIQKRKCFTRIYYSGEKASYSLNEKCGELFRAKHNSKFQNVNKPKEIYF